MHIFSHSIFSHLAGRYCLILWLLCLFIIPRVHASESQPAKKTHDQFRMHELPIKFFELQHLAMFQPSTWGGPLPPDVPGSKDARTVQDVLDRGYRGTYFVSASKEKEWAMPYKFVSSSLTRSDMAVMMSYVNTSSAAGEGSEQNLDNLPVSIGHDFDLMDLFGLQVSKHLYGVIGNLDSSGTLVLPFTGVDFSKIKRLPPRMSKLVVYNSEINADLVHLINDCPDLKELVLWGCRHDETAFAGGLQNNGERWLPYWNAEMFRPICEKLTSLTIISPTQALAESLGWHSYPKLETFTSNLYSFFRVGTWDVYNNVHVKKKQYNFVLRIPRPEVKMLKNIIYYHGMPELSEKHLIAAEKGVHEYMVKHYPDLNLKVEVRPCFMEAKQNPNQ